LAQGSLTPPGAPAPTMKTLNQVEPRTPIASAPYTISQPGSYYLTANLTNTGHGVVITANGVTLDLMGFTLSGDGGTSDYGVFLDRTTNSAIRNVVVRNGIVRNFGDGVRAEYTQDSRFESLIIAANNGNGIFLAGNSGECYGNTIADCTVSGNGGYGVYLYGDSGQCYGNTITDCTIRGNAYGVAFNGASSGRCDDNVLADCTISDNGEYGVYFHCGNSGQCDGNTVANCAISENGHYGVSLNGLSGQCDGNTIADCTIRKNVERGINMANADGNRVESNHITGQTGTTTYGIYCSATAGNLIFRNTCVGQTTNFVMNANDTYGPIVTSSGELMTTNGAAALSPWANFSR